jgi:hypothetical protein
MRRYCKDRRAYDFMIERSKNRRIAQSFMAGGFNSHANELAKEAAPVEQPAPKPERLCPGCNQPTVPLRSVTKATGTVPGQWMHLSGRVSCAEGATGTGPFIFACIKGGLPHWKVTVAEWQEAIAKVLAHPERGWTASMPARIEIADPPTPGAGDRVVYCDKWTREQWEAETKLPVVNAAAGPGPS